MESFKINDVAIKEFAKQVEDSNAHMILRLLDFERRGRFMSLKYEAIFNEQGKGQIVFNSSQFNLFTLSVENKNYFPITVLLKISPDKNQFLATNPNKKIIMGNEIDYFVADIYMKYTALFVEGARNGTIIVYFQGQMI